MHEFKRGILTHTQKKTAGFLLFNCSKYAKLNKMLPRAYTDSEWGFMVVENMAAPTPVVGVLMFPRVDEVFLREPNLMLVYA